MYCKAVASMDSTFSLETFAQASLIPVSLGAGPVSLMDASDEQWV